VCYSPGMETTTAPDLSPGYPSQGSKIGPAWAEAWATLSADPSAWHDGQALWRAVAAHHGLSPETIRGLMFRMAGPKGPLERDSRKVTTGKGIRSRTHFRVKTLES
jgi:hypothetical protein